MEFRTEIDIPHKPVLNITHDDGIVMLGSCFTDNVGALLERDGFDVCHNPMGPLYNPTSIDTAIRLALFPDARRDMIIINDEQGASHCLNFASRYTDVDESALKTKLNTELDQLRERLLKAKYLIITLGTAYVFALSEGAYTNQVVGNCHKFVASMFNRYLMGVDVVADTLKRIISYFPTDMNIIFTVSPIRHTADGLHGNQISKSTLQLGLQRTSELASDHRPTLHYFPAYEIMIDDLRDYRFYAPDMKHPSTVAVDYIYETFSKYYFSKETIANSVERRKQSLRNAHRQILK